MFCINRFKFKDPMFGFSFFISITSFQVTSCTWGISSITLDPMGFVPHWKCTLSSCTSISQASSNKIIL
jgi:hypothetical protein